MRRGLLADRVLMFDHGRIVEGRSTVASSEGVTKPAHATVSEGGAGEVIGRLLNPFDQRVGVKLNSHKR
jgi:hypothetical protein